jgi:hypothetical protein
MQRSAELNESGIVPVSRVVSLQGPYPHSPRFVHIISSSFVLNSGDIVFIIVNLKNQEKNISPYSSPKAFSNSSPKNRLVDLPAS